MTGGARLQVPSPSAAVLDAIGIGVVAVAVVVLWWRLRSRRTAHAFLRAFGMWSRGLPAEMILEAEELACRSGSGISLRLLVAAYERRRGTVRNAQELLLAARADAESASSAEGPSDEPRQTGNQRGA